jgi:hypothetical protein
MAPSLRHAGPRCEPGGTVSCTNVSRRSLFRGFPWMAGAAVGLLFGHMLTYLIVFPAIGQRDRVLAETGHASWFDTVWFVSQVAILSMIPIAVRTLRRRAQISSGTDEPGFATLWWLFRRLAPVQVVAFAALEVAERLVSRSPLAELASHRLLLVGLAVQVLCAGLVAVVAILLSGMIARIAEALARTDTRPSTEPSSPSRSWATPFRPTPPLVGAVGLRGPPASLLVHA